METAGLLALRLPLHLNLSLLFGGQASLNYRMSSNATAAMRVHQFAACRAARGLEHHAQEAEVPAAPGAMRIPRALLRYDAHCIETDQFHISPNSAARRCI